jgi:hypothetical protein
MDRRLGSGLSRCRRMDLDSVSDGYDEFPKTIKFVHHSYSRFSSPLKFKTRFDPIHFTPT